MRSITGPPRFLGSPSCTSALLSDPGRAAYTSPRRCPPCCPRTQHNEGPNDDDFEAQSHGFNTRCLRFALSVTREHARLACGWGLAFTARESNPLDYDNRFLLLLSSCSRLSLALVGPTAEESSPMRPRDGAILTKPIRYSNSSRPFIGPIKRWTSFAGTPSETRATNTSNPKSTPSSSTSVPSSETSSPRAR